MDTELQKTLPQLFFSKNDPDDIRLGDIFKSASIPEITNNDYVVVGFPDDTGIQLNGGRPGAKLAPAKIREYLYKMTPTSISFNQAKFKDIGDILVDPNINVTHQRAIFITEALHSKNAFPITLGGGHDFGFADGKAFLKKYAKEIKPLIINIDAHLDVRPNTKNGIEINHSGTPFYRLKNEFGDQFNLIEIGIQPQCNSPHHIHWAKDQSVEVITNKIQNMDELFKASVLFNNLTQETPVFLSIDIDGFSSAIAPGCSQSWATGLNIDFVLSIINWLKHHAALKGLGLYEVSPPLDTDHQTSKLAALIIHHLLFGNYHYEYKTKLWKR